MPGTIKLIRKFGKEKKAVRSTYYFNSEDMAKTIRIWQRIYKEKFENYHVHATPTLTKIKNHDTQTKHSEVFRSL